MVITTLYNRALFWIASNVLTVSDLYRVNLYTVLPFNGDAMTKAQAEAGATQLPTGNGYIQNATDLLLQAEFVAPRSAIWKPQGLISWQAQGGPITASFAMIYSHSDNRPLAHISFGSPLTAIDGDYFSLSFGPLGVVYFNYP